MLPVTVTGNVNARNSECVLWHTPFGVCTR